MKSIATYARCTSENGIKDHKYRLFAGFNGTAGAMAATALLLAGCAGGPGPAPGTGTGKGGETRYRCERGVEFSVRFADDSAVLNGTRGHEVLYRDAGGQSEQQTVYSNPLVRAEFGLGASGKEAILRYPVLPLVLRCVRD